MTNGCDHAADLASQLAQSHDGAMGVAQGSQLRRLLARCIVVTMLAFGSAANAQTSAPAGGVDGGRVAAELGFGLLPAALVVGATYVAWLVETSSCGPAAFCGLGSGLWGWIIGAASTVVLTPVVTGIVHVAAGGRGGIGWMLLGGLTGLVVGGLLGLLLGSAIYGGAQERAFAGSVVGHVVAELGYVIGLVVALEVSAADADRAPNPLPPNPFGAAMRAGVF